ncbi:MAG: prepilin-type N-terminal cleavage/methylation domain-containing protein [Candidatus Marinimicrobia bacterium]|jgi:prepilin-type N-terminal cleavage/methylation domain-containing protein|nr:prepilin-type N-terminal cleavage/methylation domain-containing protein [Candidatus Neomarinimicrobiota bacterium]MBT5462084.1 prepilin-type N-terminal cleavage/methylation domain-containing protein [Candidatus Neomarinimicrobiota bacterium]
MKFNKSNLGFSLIEVLIVLLILSGGFIILLQALNTGKTMQAKAELLTVQAVLLNDKVQEIRSRKFDENTTSPWSTTLGTESTAETNLAFDGVNDYVKVGNSTPLQLRDGQFSISVWTYVTSTASQKFLFHGLGCSTWASWFLSIGGNENNPSANNYAFGFGTSNSATNNNVYSTGNALVDQWVHLTVVYNGSLLSLYVNGELNNTATASGNPWTSNEQLYIGVDPGCGYRNAVYGKIDEIAIWNSILSISEISLLYTSSRSMDASTNSSNYSSASNLIGYWKMNEGSGGAVSDGSGNNYTGTLVNNPTWESSSIIENSIISWDDIDDFNQYTVTEFQNYPSFGCSVKVDYVNATSGFHSSVTGPTDYKRVMVEINHKTIPALRDTFIVSPGL